MNNPEDIYRQRSGIVAREIVDEFILVPVSAELAAMHSFFTLNSVGRYIWEQLNGANTLQVIVGGITQTFEVSLTTATDDLHQLIDELKQAGLITMVSTGETT